MGKRLYKKPEAANIQGVCCVEGCDNLQQVVRKGKYGTLCSPCDRLRYNTKEKDKYSAINRLYGLNKDQYDSMILEQENSCYICGLQASECPKSVLHVDHDHRTGKVRKLLCQNCNTGLGKFKDDIELLQKAIDYLKNN